VSGTAGLHAQALSAAAPHQAGGITYTHMGDTSLSCAIRNITNARTAGAIGCGVQGLHIGKEGKMELPLHMLPLCCRFTITGYFHHLVILHRLGKLPKPKLGKSARDAKYSDEKNSDALK
jgi:hypothetical protein